jgi:Flp pilus assembly protein TadG
MIKRQNRKALSITALREETGATLVEFAISLLLFLILVLGIAEFSFAIYSYHFVSYGAQQAARYAIVRGSHWNTACSSTVNYSCDASSTSIQDYVRSLASPGINPNSISVTTTWPGTTPSGSTTSCTPTNKAGCVVKITVSYPFNFSLPLVNPGVLQFSSSSQMVIQQ